MEAQELINTLLIELYPDRTDDLEDFMAAEESMDLVPDMPLIQLKQLIETHLDWALQVDLTSPDECYWFWYRSIEKEEPRLGIRGVDQGQKSSLAIRPRIACPQQFKCSPERRYGVTIDYLMANPRDSDIVRRIQTMAGSAYGEIRANLWHRDMKPMHLLRTNFRSWVRNVLTLGVTAGYESPFPGAPHL